MLMLYRRHLKGCPHRQDRYYKRCKACPMWIEGVHDSLYRRHSLKTACWEAKREMERGEEKAPCGPLARQGDRELETHVRGIDASRTGKFKLVEWMLVNLSEIAKGTRHTSKSNSM